jgi:hypothetical protein
MSVYAVVKEVGEIELTWELSHGLDIALTLPLVWIAKIFLLGVVNY